jgi:acetyl-CoA carboxylase beta subunit
MLLIIVCFSRRACMQEGTLSSMQMAKISVILQKRNSIILFMLK